MAEPPKFSSGAVDIIKGLKPNTRVPPIAEPLSNVESLAQTVKSLRQGMQSLAGFRGPVLDRAVTFRDLLDLGAFSGGGGTSAPFNLTVKDADEDTVVTAVSTIIFADGLEVSDPGGRAALVTPAGGQGYRIALYVPGAVAAGYVMLRFTATDTITIPRNAVGSEATADVASAGDPVYHIQVARGADAPNTFTTVGQFAFFSSDIAEFVFPAPVILAPNDILRVVCNVADPVIRDISLTLNATRG